MHKLASHDVSITYFNSSKHLQSNRSFMFKYEELSPSTFTHVLKKPNVRPHRSHTKQSTRCTIQEFEVKQSRYITLHGTITNSPYISTTSQTTQIHNPPKHRHFKQANTGTNTYSQRYTHSPSHNTSSRQRPYRIHHIAPIP